MVASAADDGVAPAATEASTKLLISPEVDELEAEYAKSGYFLAARLLGKIGSKIGSKSRETARETAEKRLGNGQDQYGRNSTHGTDVLEHHGGWHPWRTLGCTNIGLPVHGGPGA